MAAIDNPSDNPLKSTFGNQASYFEKVAELSPFLLFVVDLNESRVTYINQKVKELLGYDADYVYQKGTEIFKTVLHPDDYGLRLENMEKCKHLNDSQESAVEVRVKVDQIGWQWFNITEKVFERAENGAVSKLIGTLQNIHEKKLGEEKLREEHRRFENAQAIGHVGSFERELPGDWMSCSEEFFRIHGIKPRPEGISLQEFVSYVHPDDRKDLMAAVDHTHATGAPFDIVTRIIRPDGGLRHVHRRAALISNEKGEPQRVYGTVQDITERVKAEEKRKRSDSLVRATEKVAGTGSYEVDVVNNNIYFSDGLYHLFGEEPGKIVPTLEWLDSRSHPDDVPVVRQILDQATLNRKGYTYNRRIYRKDGLLRILEAHGKVIVDRNGKVKKLIGLVQDITERKQAEDEVRKSEDRSRNLLKVLQKAPNAFLVLSPSLNIEIASDMYLEATLTKRENIIGRYMFDVFPDNPAIDDPTGVKNLRASLEKVLTTKQPHIMEIQHYDVPRPGGGFEEKYWSPTNIPVVDAKGEVQYIIHRVVDETEIMKAQAALEIAVEAAEMGTWDLDLTKDFSGHRNFRHDQIFGYSTPQPVWSREIARKNVLPEDHKIFDTAYDNAMKTGKLSFEVRIRWEDGSIHWMAVNGHIYFDENGKPLRGAGVNFEVTQRRQAEQALRKSEERMKKVLSIETVGVLYYDPEGRINEVNHAFEGMSGFSKKDFVSGKVGRDELTPSEFLEVTQNSQEELLTYGQNTPYQKQFIRSDGSRWWGLVAGKRLSERECVEFVVDITEAKKVEEALIKAKEDAEAASRAKEDFVSTMSHEIRTPLNAVIGLTNLLLDRNPRADQKENLSSLSFSAKNLLALINGILDFSKLEAGKMEVEEIDFDLHDLLFSLKKTHQPLASTKGIRLMLNLDENIPECIATDQLKLSQVLHNLVGNAVKFTQEGKVTVSVELYRQDEDLLWLDFAVRDTGIGIAADHVEQIFQKFSQAESSIVRQYGGTGLGLSITKLLLELLGSEIKMESEAGEGSCFFFRLPVKPAGKENHTKEFREIPEAEKDLRHMNLLLVEDVEINRNIVLQFLQDWWQLRPDEAVNGKEAIEMAKNKQYDLILMDVRMPVMDGYEATMAIRKLPGYDNIPILALTADKNQELQQAQKTSRFSDLLTKPFEPQDLKHTILQQLEAAGKEFPDAAVKPQPFTAEEREEQDAPKPSSELAVDVSRYLEIAGENREVLDKLIANAIRALETYKREFTAAAREQSEEDLSDLVHKNTTSIHYVQANRLAKEIQKFRELMAGPAEERYRLKEQKQLVLKEFELVIEELKDNRLYR